LFTVDIEVLLSGGVAREAAKAYDGRRDLETDFHTVCERVWRSERESYNGSILNKSFLGC